LHNAPNNPSQPSAEPTAALRRVRLAIAVGLCVAIGVFAVFTIEELANAAKTPPLPTDFGAATTTQPTASMRGADGSPLPAGFAGTDPSKFIPIFRDNPHPGEIVPFQQTAPLGQPPYRQPNADSEVWELCAYELRDASLDELMSYYDAKATARGLKLIKQQPTSANMPGGVEAAWSDGLRRLDVTARPLPKPRPPLAPANPLRWVVKYSYPETNAKP
jgi:hypothetical protein